MPQKAQTKPAPRGGSWLPLAALVSIGLLTAAMSGCGGDETVTAGKQAPPARERPVRDGVRQDFCREQVGTFVDSLSTLRRRLAIGLSYEDYVAGVKRARAAYEGLPAEELRLDCLVAVATATERALNQYLGAANLWAGCLAEAGCATASIEPKLQRRWRLAERFLSEARHGLAGVVVSAK